MKLTIIGAGPGGYSAAFAAAKAGVEVTLVERAKLGGTCLHTGCIPTKTLRSSADVLEMSGRLAEFGITGECALKADRFGPVQPQELSENDENTQEI